MSEIDMSAEKVRAMLEENLARVRKASDEYFQLLEKGLNASQLPIGGQGKQFCDFMQRNVNATFDLGQQLIQAKDAQESVRIQTEFFQEQMRSMMQHVRDASEGAMKAAMGAFTPKS